MFALTLDEAKTIALVIVLGFVVAAVLVGWLVKAIVGKVILIVVLVALAALVWSQRSSLDECADRVRESVGTGDTTCSFFGRDVEISTGRS